MTHLLTKRLILRRWRENDRVPFARMNADAEVMAWFPAPLSRTDSDALADRIEAHFDHKGFGLWAVEIPSVESCAGFIGLSVPSFDAPFTPCVEIGWRLARPCWGRGYATEGARRVLDHAFGTLDMDEIVSFTATGNIRSRTVMERLGMSRDPSDDFVHPALPPDHELADHVLYRLARSRYSANTAALSP